MKHSVYAIKICITLSLLFAAFLLLSTDTIFQKLSCNYKNYINLSIIQGVFSSLMTGATISTVLYYMSYVEKLTCSFDFIFKHLCFLYRYISIIEIEQSKIFKELERSSSIWNDKSQNLDVALNMWTNVYTSLKNNRAVILDNFEYPTFIFMTKNNKVIMVNYNRLFEMLTNDNYTSLIYDIKIYFEKIKYMENYYSELHVSQQITNEASLLKKNIMEELNKNMDKLNILLKECGFLGYTFAQYCSKMENWNRITTDTSWQRP